MQNSAYAICELDVRRDRLNRWRVAATVCSTLLSLYFVFVCWRAVHMRAPIWVDGPVLDILESIRSGRIYQMDGLTSMPYTVLTHTPLAYLAGFWLYRISPGFAVLRALNVCVTLGCSALVFVWVGRRTGDGWAAAFSASSFLLMPAVFQWSRVARSPDSFCCMFSLAALVIADERVRYGTLQIGLLSALAVLSKQTAFVVLLPTLIVLANRGVKRSFADRWGWLAISAAILFPAMVYLQLSSHGGFWVNVFDGNFCEMSFPNFLRVTMTLVFFWPFLAVVWSLSGGWTSAHIWALFSVLFGLATCSKQGADTMYFFDASAAAAMLAGIALHRARGKTPLLLMLLLLPCLFIDVVFTRTLRPEVQTAYEQLLCDVRSYPTMLSEEASIPIQLHREWYWGDLFVLNQLGRSGKWNEREIDERLARRQFSAVVIRDPEHWSKTTYAIVQKEYALKRCYAAFIGEYCLYVPRP